MLVLSRKPNETIVIDGGIRLTVVSVRGNLVRLGIEAPDRVRILREELCQQGRDAGPHGASPAGEAAPRPPECPAVGPGPSPVEGGHTDERVESPRRSLARAGHHAGGSPR